jgi:hypothetical protein
MDALPSRRALPLRLRTALLLVALLLSACRSSASQAIPTPAPTVPPLKTPSGRQGVKEVMAMFDRAIVIRAMTSARGYLSPSLAATTPPMQLAALLGLRSIPRAARFSVSQVTARRATVDVVYTAASGSVHDVATLARAQGTWRISSIRSR